MRARFLCSHRLGDSPQDQHGAADVDRDRLVEDIGVDVVHGGTGEVTYLSIRCQPKVLCKVVGN